MSLFIPCKPSNVILSKMSDLALRADLKEATFGLLFKYMGKLSIEESLDERRKIEGSHF